jgi:TolB protein
MVYRLPFSARLRMLGLIGALLTLPVLSIAQHGRVVFSDGWRGTPKAAIYTMNPDGSDIVTLTDRNSADDWPTWSPDGSKILFRSTRSGGFDFYTMNADGSNPTRLTFDGQAKGSPDWSSDGSRIVFQNFDDRNIYAMNADGSNMVNLIGVGADANPRWSPDGARIAFTAYYAHANQEIYTMNADGSNVTRLTKTGQVFDGYATWSPDGAKIAWVRSDQIYTMNADGSAITSLTSMGSNYYPLWGRTGEILFSSNRGSGWGIYVMNALGFDQVRLTNDPGIMGNMWSWHAPAVPHSVALSSNPVVGGVVTSGTVTFQEASVTRRHVRMSDSSDYVLMSTYCIVPANQATGTFKIWTYGVATTTIATISADFLGTVQTTNLTLTPATLQILWLYPTAVVGGNPSMGNVRLIGKAPAGGATIGLSSNNSTAVSHPQSTLIPWGASLTQFPIDTIGVHGNSNVVISATYAGVTRTAVISVRIATPDRLVLGSSTIKGGIPVAAYVTMTGLAGPAGRTLVLSSNHPKIVVPSTLYVPPQQDRRGFWVQTQTVTSSTSGTITVSQGSVTRTATLTLTP